MSDIDELERLALAATPGKWTADGLYITAEDGTEVASHASGSHYSAGGWEAGISGQSDADFIAAASPKIVLELIAEIRRLRAAAQGVGR